jgi:orotate phosphoribosyltransferase
MPLAFRFYDNARVLSVGLSRLFRMEKSIASKLPKISVISPSPGGIPVAFGVREALSAEQIYWAEMDEGKRQFRQYLGHGDIHPCIIVDDIIRTGKAIEETARLVTELGTRVIGCGAIVRFQDSPAEVAGVKIQSLLEFDCNFYDTVDEWKKGDGKNISVPEEKVRF